MSSRIRSYLYVVVPIVLVAVVVNRSHADTVTGEVSGRVLDLTGDLPIEGANITLVNSDRGWSKETSTDTNGSFIFIQLEPGSYKVTASKNGYLSRSAIDILVRLNDTKVMVPPFRLRPLVPSIVRVITVFGERPKTIAVDLAAPVPALSELASLVESDRTTLVSLKDGALRSNFGTLLVQSLPLRGTRTFDQLALLSPGVFRVPLSAGEGPAVGIGVGTAGQFSANGLRGRSNNFTVDGSDNNDEDIGVRRQGFVSLVPQSIESVQDLQVVTAGFPAEFGRNSASMVNVVSRSGQNSTHGSLYGVFNGGGLNARNVFDTPFVDTINRGNLNGGSFSGHHLNERQYGGVIGGPLRADKLFYFFSGEGQQSRSAALKHFVVPAAGERGLRTRDGFVPIGELGGFFADRFAHSDLVGKGVFSLYPLPNNSAGPFGANNYSQVIGQRADGVISSGKVDWYLSQSHSLAGRYNFTEDRSLIPFTSDAINSSLSTRTRTQNLSLFLNTTVPDYGNALRVSYGRTRLAFPPDKGAPLIFGSSPLPGAATQVVQTRYGRFGPFGVTGPIGQLAIAPYSTIGVDVFNFPQGRVDNTFQVSDFVTLTRPAHTTKFGFDFRHSQLNSFADRNSRPLLLFGYGRVYSDCALDPSCVFGTPDGLLRGTDLASLGAHAGFLQAISTDPSADTTIGLRLSQLDFFLQDDWKVRQNLTLNFGVRYELPKAPSEVNGRIEQTFGATASAFPRLSPTGTLANQQLIARNNDAFDRAVDALRRYWGERKQIYDADRNNIAPRFGFAWDPSGDGTSVVRGGYDLAFDANLGAFTSQSRNVFPTFVPVNLDLNFNRFSAMGQYVNSPAFFTFEPTNSPLIRPGTLNVFNLGDIFATAMGGLLTQGLATSDGSLSGNGLAFTLPAKDLRTGYAQHFVLALERQFGNDFLTSLSYVASRGVKLPRFTTPNGGLISTPVFLGATDQGQLSIRDLPPSPRGSGNGRPVAGLGAFTLLENSASSTYHSLQLSIERRFREGLHFHSSWTWSHAIDEVSDQFDGRAFFALPQDSQRLDLEKGSANFDVRHRVAGFLVWDIPPLLGSTWLRDFRLALTGEFQTGQPFTVNTALDRNGDGNLTDRLDSLRGLSLSPHSSQQIRIDPSVDPSTLLAPVGTDGRVSRNSFRTDRIVSVDAAVSRTLSIREATSLQLRVEAFNLFNRTNFGVPIRILESPGFGRAFDVQLPQRSLRVSMKVVF